MSPFLSKLRAKRYRFGAVMDNLGHDAAMADSMYFDQANDYWVAAVSLATRRTVRRKVTAARRSQGQAPGPAPRFGQRHPAGTAQPTRSARRWMTGWLTDSAAGPTGPRICTGRPNRQAAQAATG